MKVTILGCGSSPGVPRIDGSWGDCDPNEPRNRRRRSSILVQTEATSVLVDTSPDLREQFISAGVKHLDGVVWSHDHADQTHGIDDLRYLSLIMRRQIEAWGDQMTLDRLQAKFRYCFEGHAGYPAIIQGRLIDGPFKIGDIPVEPIEQDHGTIPSLGFRFGDIAYNNDLVRLPERSFEQLAGIKVWIVDALRYQPHPTHTHVAQTLEWIARLRPERAILTNMHVDLDYRKLAAELPPGVEPAYDGMVIEV